MIILSINKVLDVNPTLILLLGIKVGKQVNNRYLIDDEGDKWRFEQAYLKRYGFKPMIEEVTQ